MPQWGQLVENEHPQGPICCETGGFRVWKEGQGSHSYPRHFLGLAALRLSLGVGRVTSHGAHPRGAQGLGDRPLDRPSPQPRALMEAAQKGEQGGLPGGGSE